MELNIDAIADMIKVQNEEKTDDGQPEKTETKEEIKKDYVDPISQEYIIEANNKAGGKVWRAPREDNILNDKWLVEKQRNVNW